MDDAIYDIDFDTGLPRGIYAISPAGNLITLGRDKPIKDGFRLATRAEVNAAFDAQNPPASPISIEREPESAPVTVSDNHSDAIAPSDSDQD